MQSERHPTSIASPALFVTVGSGELAIAIAASASTAPVVHLSFESSVLERPGIIEDEIEAVADRDGPPRSVCLIFPYERGARGGGDSASMASGWESGFVGPLRIAFLVTRAVVHEWIGSATAGTLTYCCPLHDDGLDAAQSSLSSAVEALSRSVAKEYGRRGVRANCIRTGDDPRAVGELLDWIGSEKASLVTAQTLVSGGRRER